jgi:hypothetical protein
MNADYNKTSIPMIHITPTSDKAKWMEFRPNTHMRRKDCKNADRGKSCRTPCGMTHPPAAV